MAVKVIVCLIIGYLFGNFQSGFFYSKLFYHKDVRDYGSGNAGTTNTLRTFGKKAGYIVFFADAIKCILAVYLIRWVIFPGAENLKLLEAITGFAVILGHNYPFYMHFKGGKGVAATGGFMFAMNPLMAIIAAIVFGIVFFTTRYVSVGSLTITALFPVMIWFFYPGEPGVFAISIAFALMAWWRHRANIKRLLNGTENKFEKKKK